jgi:hypothetical protein
MMAGVAAIPAASVLAGQLALPASTPAGIALAQRIHERLKAEPQVPIRTHHVLHAGVYTRTICVPASTVLVGALIKIPTTLVVCGHALVLLGDGEEVEVAGYQVLAASAGRQQTYIARVDTYITMSFRTQATTVEEAEQEFTDQADQLMSRTGENIVVITGE